jgi:hypothetical protein
VGSAHAIGHSFGKEQWPPSVSPSAIPWKVPISCRIQRAFLRVTPQPSLPRERLDNRSSNRFTNASPLAPEFSDAH